MFPTFLLPSDTTDTVQRHILSDIRAQCFSGLKLVRRIRCLLAGWVSPPVCTSSDLRTGGAPSLCARGHVVVSATGRRAHRGSSGIDEFVSIDPNGFYGIDNHLMGLATRFGGSGASALARSRVELLVGGLVGERPIAEVETIQRG